MWRYDGANIEIRVLRTEGYVVSAESAVLAGVRADDLTEILRLRKESGTAEWQRRVRAWVRKQTAR